MKKPKKILQDWIYESMDWLSKLVKNFWEKYIFFSRQYYLIFIVLYLVITSISFYFAFHLELETDIKNLVSNSNSYQNYEKLKKKLGGLNTVNILLELKTPSNAKNKEINLEENKNQLTKAADLFLKKLSNNEYLRKNTKNAFYKIPIDKIEKYALLYLEKEELNEIYSRLQTKIKEEIKQSNPFAPQLKKRNIPFYIDDIFHKYENENRRSSLLVNPSYTRLVIVLKPSSPSSEFGFANRYVRELKKIKKETIKESNIKLFLNGGFYNNHENNISIQNDISKISILTLVVLILFIILFFQSLRTFFVIGLPLFSGLGITFALSWLFIGRINIISAFLTSILLGLGIDYGIHLYVRFKEERSRGNGTTSALVITFSRMSLSIIFAAFTTAIAFFALMFAEFKAFFEFGFIAALGIFASVFSFFLFFPFLIFVTEKINPISASYMPVQNKSTSHLWLWIILAVFLNGLGIYSIFQKRYEYNFDKLQVHTERQIDVGKKISEVISIQKSQPIVYSFDSIEKLKRFSHKIKNINHALKGVNASLLDIVPSDVQEKLIIIRKLNHLLKTSLLFFSSKDTEYQNLKKAIWYTDYKNYSDDQLPRQLKNIFLYENLENSSKEYFYYLYPRNLEDTDEGSIKFSRDFQKICIENQELNECDKKNIIEGVSESIILLEILDMIKRDSWRILWFMVIAILIGIALVIRNLYGYILILTPLISAVFTWLGISWILQVITNMPEFSFNYISIVGFPVIIGLGIDNGFHLFRKGQEIGLNKLNTIFKETGTAIFLSNFTTFIGFLSLAFSSHPGLRSLGIMTSIGIIIIYLSFRYLFAASSLLFYQKKWLSEDESL